MTGYTIGLDIGTTGTKTVLLDPARGIIAQATRESALHSPRPGFAEADPLHWLRNVHESIREVVASAGIDAADVIAIAASGMVPAVVALDAEHRPLRNAILQNDARATDEVARVADALSGVDIVRLTGSAVTQQSVAPTLMWLRQHEPELWRKTATVVGSYDWILVALGAVPHVEVNWALESGLYTLDRRLLPAVLDAAGIDAGLLPQVVVPGERVGSLSADAAEATGLGIGTALVVGGADHVLSAFAAGVETPGDFLVKLGGAGDILAAADAPIVDPRLYLDAHPLPGLWLPNGCMATSGSLIRWFQSLVGGVSLAQLDEEAAACPPAEVLCLPYFLGEKSPLHDPDLRGSFAGMHLGHTRAHLYRSVLESIAFGFAHHVDIFREIGMTLDRGLITNGGSKSTLWKQIHSEVLGMQMLPVVGHPGASLGAALLAAIGIGAITAEDDLRRYRTLGPPVEPDPGNVAVYAETYELWRTLGVATTTVSHALARREARE